MIPASAWLTAASRHGVPPALATLGAVLCPVARLQRGTRTMMAVLLSAAPFWVVYSIQTGSDVGLALDAVSIVGDIVGLPRLRRAPGPI